MSILNKYTLRMFSEIFFLISMIIIMMTFLAQISEVFHKFTLEEISFLQFIQLATLRIPFLLQKTLPIIIFISGIYFIRKLNKSQELIAIFNGGISLFGMIKPIIIGLFGLFLFYLFIISNWSGYCYMKHSQLQSYLQNPTKYLDEEQNFWFIEQKKEGFNIFKAKSFDTKSQVLHEGEVFLMEPEKFNWIISPSMKVKNNIITIPSFKSLKPKPSPLTLTTSLEPDNFFQLKKIYLIPFWQLTIYLLRIKKSPFSMTDIMSYWIFQFCHLLFFLAMFIFGITMFLPTQKPNPLKYIFSSGAAFFFYFYIDLTYNISTKYDFVLYMGSWVPSLSSILMAYFLLYHYENS